MQIGHNIINGGSGQDTIYGGIGFDEIDAGNREDIIYGSAGADVIACGLGDDIFVFEDINDYASDYNTITDFELGSDVIDTVNILTGYDPLTDGINDFVSLTGHGKNTIVQIDNYGGANNFVNVIRLDGVTGLPDVNSLEIDGLLITS